MEDAEVAQLRKQAHEFGQKMRSAIYNDDNDERKAIRTEWEIFQGENPELFQMLTTAYYEGLSNEGKG